MFPRARGIYTHTLRSSAVALALSAGVAGGAMMAPAAMAHDAVLNSNPSNGATISELPEQITMEFSGQPQGDFNTVALSRGGEVLFDEKPEVKDRDLSVDVPDSVEATPGEYTVGYQITSSDGHATRGSFNFTVSGENSAAASSETAGSSEAQAGSETKAPEENTNEQGEQSSSVPNWLLPLGGIVVIVGALAMAIARFRNLKSDD